MPRQLRRGAPAGSRYYEYPKPGGRGLGKIGEKDWERALDAGRRGKGLPAMADAMNAPLDIVIGFMRQAKNVADGQVPDGCPAWFHNVWEQWSAIQMGHALVVSEMVLSQALDGDRTSQRIILQMAGLLKTGTFLNLNIGAGTPPVDANPPPEKPREASRGRILELVGRANDGNAGSE